MNEIYEFLGKKMPAMMLAAMMFLGMVSALHAQQPAPGGVSGGSYQYVMWLTPDGYVRNGNSGTWENNFTGGSSVGNLSTETAIRTPNIDNSWGYNFHPSIKFEKSGNSDASNRMQSATAFNFSGRNYSIFLVMKAVPVGNYNGLMSLGTTGNRDLSVITWDDSGSPNINFPGTTNDVVLSAYEGILTFEYSTGNGLFTWVNGAAGNAQGLTKNAVNYTHTGKIRVSGGGDATYGFNGNIQEIIIVSSNTTASGGMLLTDRQKIQSYLAVKYGIMLPATVNIGGGNYVNSAGTLIWDRNRAGFSAYNNFIFGIGRDDNTRLNQVQSRSQGSNMLTLYKGALNTMNNNNSAEFVADKTYMMVGSNNASSNRIYSYEYEIGEVFQSGSATERFNYRSQLIYRAQVSNSNVVGGSQTVNMQLNTAKPTYVLVSADPNFAPSATRLYTVHNKIATGIVVNDGDYISFGGFQPLPGGLSSYTLDLWVDGDHSTNNSWENIASADFTLEKYSTNAPIVQNSKTMNYHKELNFGSSAAKLRTDANYVVTSSMPYHAFVVSENPSSGEKVLITYNPTTGTGSSDQNSQRRMSLQWNGTNQIRASWNTAVSWQNAPTTSTYNYGIASMSVINGGQSAVYKDGAVTTFTPNSPTNTVRANIGNGNINTGTNSTLRFDGNIQEIIMMRGGNANTRMPDPDVARIHTYLALKYGLTLVVGDYVDADGNVVWSRSVNAGYEKCIFGIARDDESGLYQRQSKSTNFSYITMLINGSTVKPLNAENTGTLQDKQYLIAGSSGGTAIQRMAVAIEPETVYQNGSIADDMVALNIKTPTYKAQWSGFSDDSLRVTMVLSMEDFYYVQVSINDAFTPAQTKIYPISEKTAEIDLVGAYKYFRFVGFSPGPGGVIQDLKLWLRADDETSLTIEDLPASDSRVGGYPDSNGETEFPAVLEWKDLVREHDYTYAAGNTAHRAPVMKRYSPEMNYHPALRFWTNGANNTSTYLTNPNGVLTVNRPPNGHSAILVLNVNNFASTNPRRIYPLMFSNSKNTGNYDGPGYGIERPNNTNRIVARFRTSNYEYNGSNELFSFGATSILDYFQTYHSSNPSISFRFNGLEDSGGTFTWGNFDMTKPSKLGIGYDYQRALIGVCSEVIIYDRVLTQDEKTKVESYLALKYGVTLNPSNTVTKRFDYLLSDSTVLWRGNIATSDPMYGKFATFYNRVAAIIRDDVARLNNCHSHSTNVGSLLHLGVAGTRLSDNGANVGEWEKNLEAVIFGDDNATGFSPNNSTCGKFNERFNRIWLVHKMTDNDRPISLLVGAQNNSGISIGGNDIYDQEYYSRLVSTYDVYLVVGESPAEIAAGNYLAVVQMAYLNGEFQCNYVFQEIDTYITFGCVPNTTGCYSPDDVNFHGTKTFNWTQYTSRTNRSNATGLTISAGLFDLGDNAVVSSTTFKYPSGITAGVRANRGYPRSSNYPARGGVEVRRSRGITGNQSNVTISIEFEKELMPSFSISGIDGPSRCYDNISISGYCSGANHFPLITPANRTPAYKISGNTVTATGTRRLAGNNKNGTIDVEFGGAVKRIDITYNLTNRVRGTQRLFISPIKVQATAPPPPVNEDGIGFEKYVDATDVTTCEEVIYTFRLVNSNCQDKYVHFTDELIPNMQWEWETFTLDTLNTWYNPHLSINDYGGKRKLEVDSLMIPGSSDIKLKAVAVFDPNAPSGEYKNISTIEYKRYIYQFGVIPIDSINVFVDREVTLNVEWQKRQEKVQVEVISRPSYLENVDFEVTYKITNPNTEITDAFMDFDFNDNFCYIINSFKFYTDDPNAPYQSGDPVIVTGTDWNTDVTNKENNYLNLAGDANGNTGFVLPSGESYITFKIKTPIYTLLDDELDEFNQPTGNKESLYISHGLFTEMDDPCLMEAMKGVDSVKMVPYAREYQIWNWADLAYLNVLVENENNPLYDGDDKQQLGYYKNFTLMQNLASPSGNYGDGSATPLNKNVECPYMLQDPDRAKGCYGYENYTSGTYTGAVVNSSSMKVGGTGTTPFATIDATITPTVGNYCWNNGGWVPIGNTTDKFECTFNGQGFSVSDLWSNYNGLFGSIINTTIDSLGVNITGTVVSGASAVGGLAGEAGSNSHISNCYVTGNVSGTSATSHVGGLVGSLASGSSIENCYAASNVTGDGTLNPVYVGGLIGESAATTTISKSYATGSVTATGARAYAGGLLGSNNATIENCYATGAVNDADGNDGYLGGLVGRNSASISNSYAIGDVSGSGTVTTGSSGSAGCVGGLVGYTTGSTIKNSFVFSCMVKSRSTGNVGRIVGTNSGTTLTANYAYGEMRTMKSGTTAPVTMNPNGTDGGTISKPSATTPGTFKGSPYANLWNWTTIWDFVTPPGTTVKVAAGTDLPVLRAFSTSNPVFANTVQKPKIEECCIPPSVSTQPITTTPTAMCQNSGLFSQSLSIEAAGDGITYKWYYNATSTNVGGTAVPSGGTTDSYTPTSDISPGDYYYFCVVSGDCGEARSNPSGKYTVLARPTGTPSVPVGTNKSICHGTLITTTWLKGLLATSSYNTVIYTNSACTTVYGNDIYADYPTGTHTFYVLYKHTTTDCESQTTDALTLTITVNQKLTPGVSIALTTGTNPTCDGTALTFTATPSNGGTNPSYQWKVNGSNQGTSSATFTWTPLNGDAITCVMTPDLTTIPCPDPATATSNEIPITVNPLLTPLVSIAITDGTATTTTCAETPITFTATPTNPGSAPTYTWTVNGDPQQSGSSLTYTTSSLANNDKVKCILTSNAICATTTTATSNEITMTVNALPQLPTKIEKDCVIVAETIKGKVVVTPSSEVGTFQYALDKNPLSPTFGAQTTFNDLDNGIYYLKIKNTATGCIKENTTTIEIECNPNCEEVPTIEINEK